MIEWRDIKMGFFSELKSDLSQAVNTLMPEDKPEADGLDNKATEVKKPTDLDSMLNRLDDIKLDEAPQQPVEEKVLDDVDEAVKGLAKEVDEEAVKEVGEVLDEVQEPVEEVQEPVEEIPEAAPVYDEVRELEEKIEEQTREEIMIEEPKNALEAINPAHINKYVADVNAETEIITRNGGMVTMDFEQQTPTDEVASITEGMIIKGDIATTGSLDLFGKVTGNIKCLGKLNITGEINGDSDAAEVYAESARITGEVKSKSSVKVGQSTVIVGNIYGSSAVIAGAVKGDIDVHGPVVLDTTAIVMGNIKSQSVQINNGAVIEGMCSQAYADVNPSEFFEGLKNK
jgi:cytoskeletal protein CcmA (bactofilin family)